MCPDERCVAYGRFTRKLKHHLQYRETLSSGYSASILYHEKELLRRSQGSSDTINEELITFAQFLVHVIVLINDFG